MGKERRPRSSKCRAAPIVLRGQPIAPIKPSEASVQTAKQQLQRPNFEDKLCGLQTLATLLESEENIKVIEEHDVVRVIAPLLIDDSPAVRSSAAGTLRNFSALGLEACDYLTDQDVMTLLVAFFQKYAENWIPKQTKSGKLNEDGEAFLHCVHLLWNICESSESSIQYINDVHVLPILTRCLDREIFGDEMVIAVTHCLFVIMEDNPNAINEIGNLCEEAVKKILSTENNEPVDILLKTLNAGITLNIQSKSSSLISDEIIQGVINILAMTLSVDIRNTCHHLSSVLPLMDDSVDPKKHQQNVEVQKEITTSKYLLDAVQTAIEILTNMCSAEDENNMDIDAQSDSDSDMDDDNIDCCNGVVSNNKLNVTISNSIVSNGLLEKTWQKSLDLAENVTQILSESDVGKNILHRYSIVRSRALLCLNNFIENLPIDALGSYPGMYNMWVETGKLVFKNSSESFNNEEILESATSVMRAALGRIKTNVHSTNGLAVICDLFKELSDTDIQVMLKCITECQCLETRANLIRMIGELTLIFIAKASPTPSSIEVIISEYLLDRIFKETDCWVLAETLDTLMDMFSEDETDKLAYQIKLVNKLVEITPIFKNKTRLQKKKLGDHYATVSTVVTNLPRFIKYKKGRIALLK